MMKLLTCLSNLFRRKEKVHFIPRLPIGLEISDGDKALLYGWPDLLIDEVLEHETA